MSTFRHAPSQRRQPRPTATWLVLGTTRAGQVARGDLVAHITPVKAGDHVKRYHGPIDMAGATRVQRLAVKGYVGGATVCHVNVTSAERVPLSAIDYPVARELGHTRVDAFQVDWIRARDETWWRKVQESLEGAEPDLAVLERFEERFAKRWARKDVWLIRFRVDAVTAPRLLAAAPATHDPEKVNEETRDEDRGYTYSPDRALRDEPAALTDSEYEVHVARRAEVSLGQRQALYDAHRQALAERETIGERLDRLIRENTAAGLSTSKEVRVVEKRLAALEQQIRRPAA